MTPDQLYEQMVYFSNGCFNHGCRIKAPVGMATNGPCRCMERLKDILKELNTQ